MSKEIVEYPAAYFFGLGIRQERERIIELLKQNQCKSPNCPCLNCQITRKQIALIKDKANA